MPEHIQRIIEQYSGYKSSPTDLLDAEKYMNEYLKKLVSQGFKVTVSEEDLLVDELTPLHKIDEAYLDKELLPYYIEMDNVPRIIVEAYPSKDFGKRYMIGDGNHRAFAMAYKLQKPEINAYLMECNFTHTGPIGLEKTIGEMQPEDWVERTTRPRKVA